MIKGKIESIQKDIEAYKQAIEDAKDALAAAEEELDEILSSEFEKAEPEQDTDDVQEAELVFHTFEVQVTIDGMKYPATKYTFAESNIGDNEVPFK